MLRNLLKRSPNLSNHWASASPAPLNPTPPSVQQVRNKWANWWMIRDVKRRRMNAENYLERLRWTCLKKNDVLPSDVREEAKEKIESFPLDSTPLRMNDRCAVTSRPRGVVKDFRLSRIVFRHLADYNKLSGVQRAIWGYGYPQQTARLNKKLKPGL